MISKELIDRINFLSHKERSEGLTEDEKYEQKLAREEYLKAIRAQVRETLESAGFKPKSVRNSNSGCKCGHCTGHHQKH